MKISFNEVVETLAPAIAGKLKFRVIMERVNGDIMLIDFSSCGVPFDGDTVCVWSLQDSGMEEIDCGSFDSFFDVFMFVFGQAMTDGKKLYVDSY